MLDSFCWAEVREFAVKLRQVPAFPPQKGEAQDKSKVWKQSGLWKGWSLTAERWWKLNIYSQNLDFRPRWEDGAAEVTEGSVLIWAEFHLSISLVPSSNSQQINLFSLLFTCAAVLLMHTMMLLVSPALHLLLVLHLRGQCPCRYLKEEEIFLDLNLVLFICFPCYLYNHRNSLLPSQEIICK